MSLKCILNHNTNPRKAGGAGVTAQHMSAGLYTFDMMADDIAHSCSLTRADVAAAMEALIEHTKRRLLEGCSVEYRGLGRFFINFDSRLTPAETVQQPGFRVQTIIKGFRLRFIPFIGIRRWMADNATVELADQASPVPS